jgi:hypothetical protein
MGGFKAPRSRVRSEVLGVAQVVHPSAIGWVVDSQHSPFRRGRGNHCSLIVFPFDESGSKEGIANCDPISRAVDHVCCSRSLRPVPPNRSISNRAGVSNLVVAHDRARRQAFQIEPSIRVKDVVVDHAHWEYKRKL